MTIPLEKPLARLLPHPTRLAGQVVIELGRSGVSFRDKGARTRLALSWREIYLLAERRAGELAHQEKLRDHAIRRAARGGR